jgi:hypothetical protein
MAPNPPIVRGGPAKPFRPSITLGGWVGNSAYNHLCSGTPSDSPLGLPTRDPPSRDLWLSA